MLSPNQVERWALSVLDAIGGSAPREDSRVELKREWPDPVKAARRIAGHANAARGEDVLWLIGVDEEQGIVGAPKTDLAVWLPAVCACFDGPGPVLTDVVVMYANKPVHALAFDTSRAPFVVGNPAFGIAKGEGVSLEIPWRDGTKIRTARRNEVLRMLTHVERLPDVEVLSGAVKGSWSSTPQQTRDRLAIAATLALELYLMPRGPEPLILPVHRTTCSLTTNEAGSRIVITRLHHSARASRRSSADKWTSFVSRQAKFQPTEVVVRDEDTDPILVSEAEVIVRRSAHITVHGFVDIPQAIWDATKTFRCVIEYQIGIDRLPFTIILDAPKQDATSS